ncbi:MAG: SRPBCC family protein [Mycobacterium sp.]
MVFDVRVAHISRARTVAADISAVWDVLADFGAISSWAAAVDHSCLLWPSTEPIGLARRIQMGRTTVIERIVEFDPHRALAYDIEGLPPMVRRMQNRWELSSAATGLTMVTLTTTVAIGEHLPQRLAEHLVCRLAAKQSDGLLDGLATSWKDTRAA